MPDTYSILTVKEFLYRGQPEEWSNRYHFDGFAPANETEWKAVADTFIQAERTIVTGATKFVRAYGYQAGIEHSVFQIDYESPPNTVLSGTFVPASGSFMPGDAAACIRWYTGEVNSRGKKVYCWKYIHDISSAGANKDDLLPAQLTAMQAFATTLIDGSLFQDINYCGPQGATLQDPKVLPHVTTRTLKRRGKRPFPAG